jgi:hypothetical protein
LRNLQHGRGRADPARRERQRAGIGGEPGERRPVGLGFAHPGLHGWRGAHHRRWRAVGRWRWWRRHAGRWLLTVEDRPARRADDQDRDQAEHRGRQEPEPEVDRHPGGHRRGQEDHQQERDPEQPGRPHRPAAQRHARLQPDEQQAQAGHDDQRDDVQDQLGRALEGVEQHLVHVGLAAEVALLIADPAVVVAERAQVGSGQADVGVAVERAAEHLGGADREEPRQQKRRNNPDNAEPRQRHGVVLVAGALAGERDEQRPEHRQQRDQRAGRGGRPHPVTWADARPEDPVGKGEQRPRDLHECVHGSLLVPPLTPKD